MKHWSKRVLSLLMSALLLTGLLSTGAMASAAEAARPIGVELNGKPVAFSGAEPMMNGGRTYVPMRAVFEALGAEVDYVSAERRVIAQRDGVTVSMVVGEKQVTITKGGLSVVQPMDAAAYIQGGRTYVPVRFAAQALGCVVGWDKDDRTVIIVDVDPLVREAAAANQYTLLEKYNAYAARFNEGTWNTEMTMAMVFSFVSTQVMKMDGTMSGVTKDTTAGEMTMDMKLDMSGMADLVALLTQATKEEALAALEMTEQEMVMDVSMELRMDLEAGNLYMLVSGMPKEAGLPADTWLSMDMDEMLKASGQTFDMAQLSAFGQAQMDPVTRIAALMPAMSLTDKDTAVETVRSAVDEAALSMSDSSFAKVGDTYTLKLDGGNTTLQLTTNEAGEVVGYESTATVSVDLAQAGVDVSQLDGLGVDAKTATLTVKTAMDADNNMTADMKLDMGQLAAMDMTISGKYTAGDRQPSTALPEGAAVVDYLEWLEQNS